jgi:hypothetical protein
MGYNKTTSSSSSGGDTYLEPRVAKLETGLDILTRDVTTLAQVVREQSKNIEREIQSLAVAVSQASGPRKTDWSTVISAIFLIMAIGSAVFWPLNQTVRNTHDGLEKVQAQISEHMAQPSHPVSQVLVDQIKERVTKLEANNDERNKEELNRGKLLEFLQQRAQ